MRRTTFTGETLPAPVAERDPLLCAAKGCPNRWSVNMGNGALCSWHDRSPRHLWPQITQGELDAQTERARQVPSDPEPNRLNAAEKLAILAKLREVATGRTVELHAWAKSLRSRKDAGEILTLAQKQCLDAFERRRGG
jgi:hypothetical protein